MPPPVPTLAFGFANLAMLGWLAAAAAPILIHLWMRQTHRETAWAAVRFLRAALERQARRLRLQHWLLLATRTLLLVLVALAAAKPLLDGGALGLAQPTHHVLIVDASLSMTARDASGRSAFEAAKAVASDVLAAAGPNDRFTVIAAGPAGGAMTTATADRTLAQRTVDDLTVTDGRADLVAALEAADAALDRGAEGTPDLRQRVLVLSDLTATSWGVFADELAAPSNADDEASATDRRVEPIVERLAERADLAAYDLAPDATANVAVVAIDASDGPTTLAGPVEFTAEAVWHRVDTADSQPRPASFELVVDGAVVATRSVTRDPGSGQAIVDFSHRFAVAGDRTVAVRLAGTEDALAADNTRWLTLPVASRLRVLCVAGSPGAARYVADALDPRGDGSAAYEPIVVSDADLASLRFSDYACVLLSNVVELSTDEAERLTRYALSGGGVGLLLGDRVDGTRYNALFGPPASRLGEARRARRLPVRRVSNEANEAERADATGTERVATLLPGVLAPSVASGAYRLDPLGYAHPIVTPFDGFERGGLLTTPVARHVPLEVTDPTARVAVALAGGDPLLVTTEVGRGRSAVLTTAASLAIRDAATGEPWSALPAWPSFLPLVRGLVDHLAGGGGSSGAVTVGESINGPLPAEGDAADAGVRVTTPSGDTVVAARVGPDAWSIGPATSAGVYTYSPADTAADQGPSGAIAANPDPAESDLAKIDASRIDDRFRVVRGGDGMTDVATLDAAPTPLHRWLLLGALSLALIEPAMACAFGRGGR